MKQFAALSLCLTMGLLLSFHLACGQDISIQPTAPGSTPQATGTPTITSSPTNTTTPTITSTPCSCTPTPTPIHIYYNGSFQYSLTPTSGAGISSPVNAAVGQQVIFDSNLAGHPLYIDNGSSCSVNNNNSFPATFSPPASADYLVHCGLHGACSNNAACPASSCGGMAFTLHVP